MKTKTQNSRKGNMIFLFVALSLCLVSKTNAQELWKTNPKQCIVLHDTVGVKMTLITLAPGESLAPHTHSLFQAYVVEGGDLEGQTPGTAPTKSTLPTGLHFQAPAMGVHTDKNVGITTVKLLVVEIFPSKDQKGKTK